MRGILIDPFAKTVTDVDYDGTLEHMYALLQCTMITTVGVVRDRDGRDETLFVDDEGLYVADQRYFMWKGYPQPLAGRGLVLGTDGEGASVDTKLSVAFVDKDITWPNFRFSHMTTSSEDRGKLGTLISIEPHFIDEDDTKQ